VETVYLDVCCLNCPFDNQSQARIRREAEAVERLLEMAAEGTIRWVTSSVVDDEIRAATNPERRDGLLALLTLAHVTVELDAGAEARAVELTELGFSSVDALHLAAAEAAEALFLTTDDRLLRRALRTPDAMAIRVANPSTWVAEVIR
jgi:predicted nucleic acid-binding protein